MCPEGISGWEGGVSRVQDQAVFSEQESAWLSSYRHTLGLWRPGLLDLGLSSPDVPVRWGHFLFFVIFNQACEAAQSSSTSSPCLDEDTATAVSHGAVGSPSPTSAGAGLC